MFNQMKKNAILAFMLCSTVVLFVEKSEAGDFLSAIRKNGAQGNNGSDVTAENVSAVTTRNDGKIKALFMKAQLLTPDGVFSVQKFSENCAGLFGALKGLPLSDDEARQKIYDEIKDKIQINPEFVNYLIDITVNSKVTFSPNTDTSASSASKPSAKPTQNPGFAMDANAIESVRNRLNKTGIISLDINQSSGSDDNKSSGSGSDNNKPSSQKITLKKTELSGNGSPDRDESKPNQLNLNVKLKPVSSSPYSDVQKVTKMPYGSEHSDSTVSPAKASVVPYPKNTTLNGASNNQSQTYGSRTQTYEPRNSPPYSAYVKKVTNTPDTSDDSDSELADLLKDNPLF